VLNYFFYEYENTRLQKNRK